MQEVFSKIIEELEIERTTANNTFMKYEINVDLGRVFGLEKAIEIVKQEAEKFGRDTNVGSNGNGVLKFANLLKELCCKKDEDYDNPVISPKYLNDTIENLLLDYNEQYNNGWIPCSVAMPPVETEVFIVAKRKYRGGEVRYITTTAMYEDGTVLENDSCWIWEDIDGEWDEENDCCIIPEGWWENRHYNTDEVYNNSVDDEVVAWQPLPQPYQTKGE